MTHRLAFPYEKALVSFFSDLIDEAAKALRPVHNEEATVGKKRKKLKGSVQKIIKPFGPNEPEKAQIEINGGDDLYREIRIENVVTDEEGDTAPLKPGAKVDVIVEADSNATLKKPE